MYSVAGYGAMIADGVRMRAYAEALRQAVKPDSVVLDIGTGTGIFAMLACAYGARRVYAVEPDDAIQVARELAAANGFGQRIEFIQGLSANITLPERVDVIVSDLRGILPLFERHIPAIVDARNRLLIDGGKLIPREDTVRVAVAGARDVYERCTTPWGTDTFGLDMEPARRIVANRWTKVRVTPNRVLLPPQTWCTLDYSTIRDASVDGTLTWIAERAGTAHGVVVWFDAMLADGVQFSNAPGEPELIYGSAFFPWSRPVKLSRGDAVSVTLRANLVGDDYVWRWDADVRDDAGRVKANFRQNTLAGAPLSAERLRRRAHDHVPALTESGQVAQAILERMAAGMRLDEISREIALRFPRRFPSWREALTEVGDLSAWYGR